MSSLVSGVLKNTYIFGKYIDQPALVKKVYKAMPPVLVAGAAGYGIYDTFNNKNVKYGKESQFKRFVKNAAIMTGTIASTLIFGKKFIKKHLPHIHKHDIEHVIEKVKDDKTITGLLGDIKEGKTLSYKQIKTLYEGLSTKGKGLLDKVIPSGHSHAHGHGHKQGFFDKNPEFSEIKDLSILGAIPVIGGIAGGVAGDSLTGEKLGETVPDKIKEGSYQYLANIVLCNVGAGAALFGINRTKYKNSRPAKFFAMLGGILAVGVAGGSLIANFIGKKIVNPMLDHHKKTEKHAQGNPEKHKGFYKELYNERTPEAIDIGLHIDDFAAAGFLAGLNVITPALPVLYSVSAYRAGIGYRNNKENKHNQAPEPFLGEKDAFHKFRKRKYHYSHH